MFVFFSVSQ